MPEIIRNNSERARTQVKFKEKHGMEPIMVALWKSRPVFSDEHDEKELQLNIANSKIFERLFPQYTEGLTRRPRASDRVHYSMEAYDGNIEYTLWAGCGYDDLTGSRIEGNRIISEFEEGKNLVIKSTIETPSDVFVSIPLPNTKMNSAFSIRENLEFEYVLDKLIRNIPISPNTLDVVLKPEVGVCGSALDGRAGVVGADLDDIVVLGDDGNLIPKSREWSYVRPRFYEYKGGLEADLFNPTKDRVDAAVYAMYCLKSLLTKPENQEKIYEAANIISMALILHKKIEGLRYHHKSVKPPIPLFEAERNKLLQTADGILSTIEVPEKLKQMDKLFY